MDARLLLSAVVLMVATASAKPQSGRPNDVRYCDNGAEVPFGYEYKNGKWYKFYSDRHDYYDSKRECEYDGATLAMFKNPFDHDAVRMFKDRADAKDMWVGIHNPDRNRCQKDSRCDGKFEWVDGSRVDYHDYFTPGMQANDGEECLRLKKSGAVDDKPCSNRWPRLCQYDCHDHDTSEPSGKFCDNGKRVPHGYQYKLGKYYKLKLDSKDYYDSKNDCEYDGATLAMFKTEEDHEAILMFKKSAQVHDLWVGIHNPDRNRCQKDSRCDGKFEWVDGSRVDYHNYFTPGMQANDGEECLRLKKSGAVDDKPCSNRWPRLCQYDCYYED